MQLFDYLSLFQLIFNYLHLCSIFNYNKLKDAHEA